MDPFSRYPPTSTVLPSADRATDEPCSPPPNASDPTSFPPCCVHTPRLRVKLHGAPLEAWSALPPPAAVFPSPGAATAHPCCAAPAAPAPISFAPCCVHVPPLRVNTHAAPTEEL